MDTIKQNWIICFGDHWTKTHRRSTGNMMMELWKRGYNILWINPIPKTSLSAKKVQGKYQLALKLVINKIKRHVNMLSVVEKGFIVITPVYYPLLDSAFAQKLNRALQYCQIKLVRMCYGIRDYYLVNITSNVVTDFVDMSKCKSFIHIAGDLHSDYRVATDKQKRAIEKNEAYLFNAVEYVFPASRQIMDKIVCKYGHKEKLTMLPHGVDFDHFYRVQNPDPRMNSYKKPIIGYFGSLTLANDTSIYEEIARAGFTFVLIGEDKGDYQKLKQYPNVFFLGPISYNDLPRYAVSFDVCIMAWRKHAWIENCNPKKTLEYLALGKPIVSISIPYLIEAYSQFIYFADDPTSFVESIHRALQEDSPEKIRERQLEASKNDWSFVVDKMLAKLNWSSNI